MATRCWRSHTASLLPLHCEESSPHPQSSLCGNTARCLSEPRGIHQAPAPAQVRGDAWVARILDDDDTFERLDFHVSDLEPTAPWVAIAAQQRIGRLRAPAQTIIARIRAYCAEKRAAQPDAEPRELTAAEAAQVPPHPNPPVIPPGPLHHPSMCR